VKAKWCRYSILPPEVILEIAEASAAQVDAAVEAADRAFVSWSQTTPKTRAETLLKLADAITDQLKRWRSWNP
jgi:acyl-CoA reductase-like NAD-dependent aldehyde dehydrogenase